MNDTPRDYEGEVWRNHDTQRAVDRTAAIRAFAAKVAAGWKPRTYADHREVADHAAHTAAREPGA